MGQSWTNKVRRLGMLCAVNLSLYLNCFAGVEQGEKKVTLNVVEESCVKVFKQIEKQTKMSFFYSTSDVKLPVKVSINVVNAGLDEVMERILEGTGLEWVYTDNIITIRKKKERGSLQIGSTGDSTITSITISGIVTAADGTPIPRATVRLKKTNEGITTDADGHFVLPNVKNDDQLIISSIGYETREMPVKGKSILVQLNVVVNELDETVVIAYGTTTKRNNIGNVGTVKAREIEKQPVNNPLLALQGRVPGLFIEQSTGLPGSGVKVRIQGQTSLNKGSDPLYVIDGVPYTSQLLPSLNGILGTSGNTVGAIPSGAGNPLSFLNPQEIESIEILKDADATSIYGSRAAAGAILITTKKGKPGKTKVDINIQHGWGKVHKKLDLLDTKQYLTMRHEAKRNDNLPIEPTDYDINGAWDTTRYTDWQKILIGGTAKYTDVQTSISGGSANTQFLLGMGYHRETTVFPGDFSDRKGSVHFDVNTNSPDQKFKVNLSGTYLLDNNKLPSLDLTTYARSMAPNAPELYNADGTLNWAPDASGTTTFLNPLAELNKRYSIETKNLVSNLVLSYEVIPGLEIKSSLGYNDLRSEETVTTPVTYFRPEFILAYGNILRNALYGTNNINSWIIEPQLNYRKTFGKSKLEVLFGSTFNQINTKGLQLYGSNYNSDEVIEDIRSAGSIRVVNSIQSTYKYNAVFGRVIYTWNNNYFLNLSARRDGSSRFGSENLFHNFGSVAAGWVFSNENFITQSLRFLSFGKIRASYGTSGNDQIGDYQFLNLYYPIGVQIPYLGAPGLEPIGLPNPYLQWEETRKTQFGLDLGVLDNRILLNASYYHNRSANQLVDYVLPITAGFSYITENFPATIQNTGWELSLNTINIKSGQVNWFSNINFTIAKNKLVSFPNLDKSSYAGNLVVGEPFTLNKVYNFAGVDPTTGSYQFYNKDGKLTATPDPSTDRTVLINTSPTFYGGVQNTFTYKGFELSCLFQFAKQKGQNYFYGTLPPGANGNNQPVSVWDRWQKPGNVAPVQRFNSDFSLYQSLNDALSSSAGWTDASYIRLKNASLSWELPKTWKNRIGFQNARLYVHAQNLLTITGYDGYDPENRSAGSLPPLRVITFGIRVTP